MARAWHPDRYGVAWVDLSDPRSYPITRQFPSPLSS
jgi:hypothetical protein